MGNVSIGVKLKPEAGAGGLHVVRLHITKDRTVRKWQTSIEIALKQFNPAGKKDLANWIRKSHHEHRVYNERIKRAYEHAEVVVSELENTRRPFTVDDVLLRLKSGGRPDTLLGYYAAYLHRRRQLAGNDLSKLKTCDGLESTLRVLRHYLRETYRPLATLTGEQLDAVPRLLLRSLTRAVMEDIRAWMEKSYADNSIATYFSNIRTVLYAAVDDKIISLDDFPLRKFTIAHTRKKVSRLQEADIDRLSTTQPLKKTKGGHPAVTDPNYAQPFALALYYAHGARVRDMLMMRMKHYQVSQHEHRLVYTTGKTDRELSVLLDEEAIAIFASCRIRGDGSEKKPGEFLFPYLPARFDKLPVGEQYLELRRAGNRVRGQLRRLSERIGLGKPLTPHVMRHSFADMMRRNGVPIETRQMALGHADIRTTRDYEEQFDKQAVDRISGLYRKGSTIGQQTGKQQTANDRRSDTENESDGLD